MIVDRKIANIALPAFASTTLLPRLCFHGFASMALPQKIFTTRTRRACYRAAFTGRSRARSSDTPSPGITLDLYSGVTMQADAAIVDGAVRAALNKREQKGGKTVAATRFGGCGTFRDLDKSGFAGLAQW
jgi:hypothetical protein